MTGYAHSSSEHVIGALRGPAGVRDPARSLSSTEARRRGVDVALGVGALLAILACALVVVVAAADRPSILAATTTPHFFPRWMAGPLGGLWPSLTRDTKGLRYLFSGAIACMYVSYLVGLKYVPRLRARWAIAAVLGAHAIMFLAPPLALTDIFNYVNYGRMEIVHHLNPYTTVPVLEPHSDPSYALSNWHQLLSPYGPMFTLMTFAVVPFGVGASLWMLKGLLMLASLGTVLLVWRSARLLGRDPVAAIVLVGLNPIVLIWGLGGDHNDFLMMFFVVLGFYLLLRAGCMPGAFRGEGDAAARVGTGLGRFDHARAGHAGKDAGAGRRELGAENGQAVLWSPTIMGAGAAFVAAVAIKASAGILLPVVLVGLAHRKRDLVQMVLGMALSGVVLGVCSVAAFGPHFPDLATQGRLVTMVSMPNLLGLALGQGGETETLRLLLSGVLVVCVAACAVLAWRRRESLTAAGWASVALLVTLSWVLPWYVLWILPLAALSSSRRLRTTVLLLGVYFIVAWAPVTGYAFNAIGFHPEKTSLGRLHQRYVKELLY
ncbi:MAG TPA: hypothetical protein VNX67_00540 [Solirubrobacteraceae bacterium]|jgi:hypothetical protein|nr:hypothetical protein [Solirubrobacteraceae bacterium]